MDDNAAYYVFSVYFAYHTQQCMQYLSTYLALTGILQVWFLSHLCTHRGALEVHFLTSWSNHKARVL